MEPNNLMMSLLAELADKDTYPPLSNSELITALSHRDMMVQVWAELVCKKRGIQVVRS